MLKVTTQIIIFLFTHFPSRLLRLQDSYDRYIPYSVRASISTHPPPPPPPPFISFSVDLTLHDLLCLRLGIAQRQSTSLTTGLHTNVNADACAHSSTVFHSAKNHGCNSLEFSVHTLVSPAHIWAFWSRMMATVMSLDWQRPLPYSGSAITTKSLGIVAARRPVLHQLQCFRHFIAPPPTALLPRLFSRLVHNTTLINYVDTTV
ncbi:hypothetical protein GGS21DRAFT_325698 [Xylaria nigripes]|nr:hypothetical protein GGS21DRAFT_325698 [Xylaria nigripes]